MGTLIDTVYEEIREAIISGELKPGQKLHIAQLADRYQVGLSPVREALSRLLATELVTTVSQKGFQVAAISAADLADIYQTRAEIEALALRFSIERGDDQWEANIIASYHRLAKFESENPLKNKTDYQEWEKRHRNFNLALINACGLKHLLRIQEQLYTLTERYRRRWLLLGTGHKEGLPYAKEQKKIMDAALARDVVLAMKLLLRHYENALKAISAYYMRHNLFKG